MFRYFMIFTLLLSFFSTQVIADIMYPDLSVVQGKVKDNIKAKDDPQVMELADLKIVIPLKNSKLEDDQCVVLVHAQNNLKNVYDARNIINNGIESDSGECSLLKDAKDYLQQTNNKKDSHWNLSFHFGFSRTFYNKTDMQLKSDRVDVTIKDFEFDERTSAGFYNPANWQGASDTFRWIDEPTNHFVITAEKNGHSIILSIFHPKFLKKRYQTKNVSGVVDGVAVNDYLEINEEFDGYNNQVGEMYLVRFENTHMQMAWQVGYGYEIKLIESQKYGALSVRPSVLVGLMSGQHLTVYTKEGEYWEFDDFKDDHQIQGVMGSVGLRVNYKIKAFNFFVDGKYSYASLEHGFGDENGRASYDLSYAAITFGIGYTIPMKNKRKRRKKEKNKF